MTTTTSVTPTQCVPELIVRVARGSIDSGRPEGSLLFMSGTAPRRPGLGLTIASTMTAAMPALIGNLAWSSHPCASTSSHLALSIHRYRHLCWATTFEKRRQQLRNTLPIRRVVGASDVAALAVHMMANTALTGAT